MKGIKRKRRVLPPAPRVLYQLFGANLTNEPAVGKRVSNLEAGYAW